ncbi:MAG: hypothetical protein NW208_01095 [Bryobacter sp.]|nr:hypothetical protein [Bryobacter sp.]
MWSRNLFLGLLTSAIAFGQSTANTPACDQQCLEAWWTQIEKQTDLLPPELQHESWLKLGHQQKDVVKVKFLIRNAWERIWECQELYPVQNRLLFTDSIPGAAARLSRIYPTQLGLRLEYVLLLARHDLDEAVSLMRSFKIPITEQKSYERFENANPFSYYDTVFKIVDLCYQQSNFLTGNLLLASAIGGAKSWEALGALNMFLEFRAQQKRMPDQWIKLYLDNLTKLEVVSFPAANTWLSLLPFWRTLAQGELRTSRHQLWDALGKLFSYTKQETVFDPWIDYELNVDRPLVVPPYWPGKAKKLWLGAIASLGEDDAEKKQLSQLTATIFDRPEPPMGKAPTRVTLLHARPEARKLYAQASQLIRSREKLQPIGAWEGQLNGYLTSVRNFSEKVETDEQRLLVFLEKHYAWLYALQGFGQSPSKMPRTSEEMLKLQAARPEHNLKSVILRDVLASLESEEGRWVYRHRRLFWLGFLKLYVAELRDHQPQLLKEFQEMAGASSSEIIRHIALQQ